MAVPTEIIRLLEQLERVSSPVARFKLLAGGWKSLRKLDRSQIRVLASQLGFEGAEDLLTRLARGRGIDIGLAIRALRRAKDADPREIKEFVVSLRDQKRQEQLLRRGAEFVADSLDPEGDPPAVASEPAKEKSTAEEKPKSADPPRVAERKVIPVVAARPAAAPDPPVTPIRHTLTPIDPPAVNKKLTPPPPPPPVPSPRDATVEPPAGRGGAGSTIDRLRGERSPILRFRRLQEGIESLRREDVERLDELLGCFPSGWQRRRALAALLRRRIPADLHRAIYLIERLDDPAAERWCASALLDAWDLKPAEREAIAARHRLRLRRGA